MRIWAVSRLAAAIVSRVLQGFRSRLQHVHTVSSVLQSVFPPS